MRRTGNLHVRYTLLKEFKGEAWPVGCGMYRVRWTTQFGRPAKSPENGAYHATLGGDLLQMF